MRPIFLLPLLAILASPLAPASAQVQQAVEPSPQVDYKGFKDLTAEVYEYRRDRVVPLKDFKARAAKPGVLLLDARTPSAFARGHIKGAINMPFTDFTDEALREAIGDDPNREILIYCNNNFVDDVAPVMLKSVRLALNIQTFINLYGYGYRNIYELGGAYSIKDREIEWRSKVASAN
jgi:phage shock protein E